MTSRPVDYEMRAKSTVRREWRRAAASRHHERTAWFVAQARVQRPLPSCTNPASDRTLSERIYLNQEQPPAFCFERFYRWADVKRTACFMELFIEQSGKIFTKPKDMNQENYSKKKKKKKILLLLNEMSFLPHWSCLCFFLLFFLNLLHESQDQHINTQRPFEV